MSSQDTIHPCDNRVLSIRELMTLMTIPNSFKWTSNDDNLTVDNSDEYLKKNEGNIRRCIGEAVPTQIISDIALKLSPLLDYCDYIADENNYIPNNIFDICSKENGKLIYSDVFPAIDDLKEDISSIKIKIVGTRNFLIYYPQLISFFSHLNTIDIDLYDAKEYDNIILDDYLSSLAQPINVKVKVVQHYQPLEKYNLLIREGKCFQIERKNKRVSYNALNNEQPSLF